MSSLPRPHAAIITAATPATTATKNATLPPALSAMSPAVYAPTAAPTPSAVIVQLSPSVSASEGTSFWTKVNPEMSVGAIATPAKIEAGVMSATLGTRTSGIVPTHSTTTDATNRLSSGQRQLRAPYASPANRLPRATSASRGPAAAGAPTWPANATIATSKVPKIAPAATKVATSTRSPGVPMADLSDWSRTPTGVGSVRRWSASASEPTVVRKRAPSNPAPGATPSARAVTSAGPSTKMSSSRMDSSANADSRTGEPPTRADHRALTSDPTCSAPAPDSAAVASSTELGAES